MRNVRNGRRDSSLPLHHNRQLETRGWATVFSVRATKDELVVMELFGLQNPATPEVRVLAHIRTSGQPSNGNRKRRFTPFRPWITRMRFADQATVCFEYLGCIVGTRYPSKTTPTMIIPDLYGTPDPTKQPDPLASWGHFGPAWTRTRDLPIMSRLL